VNGDGVAERVDHDLAGDGPVRGDRDGVAGVVVDEAQDLGVGAVAEAVVGEVGLPALIRELGCEAHIGGLGPFGGLGSDQTPSGQVAGDAGPGHHQPVALAQMPADRVRSRVEALARQVLAQLDDQLDRGLRQRPGRALRAPRPGLERVVALGPVAGHQLAHPPRRYPIAPGYLSLSAPLDNNRGDDQTGLGHRRASRPTTHQRWTQPFPIS
jgi:hypothetical protein